MTETPDDTMKDEEQNTSSKPTRSRTSLVVCIVILATASVLIIHSNIKNFHQPQPSAEQDFYTMGTLANAKFYAKDAGSAEKAVQAVQNVFKEIETLCNIFDPESELSRLNKTAATKPFQCSEELWAILADARKYYQLSDGAFDVTAKPLMDLWGFYRKRKQLPSDAEIKNVLTKVGLDKVRFNEKDRSVFFSIPGMAFDLGGIAKGYAVEQAAKRVKSLGVTSGTINLGGNIYCLPSPPPGRNSYTIGIKDPLNKTRLFGYIKTTDAALATSGNYERYVILANQRITHIMNTETGQPVENMLSVTILTPSATASDALSTSVFIKGKPLAEKLVEAIPGTSVLIIRNKPGAPQKLIIEKVGDLWKHPDKFELSAEN